MNELIFEPKAGLQSSYETSAIATYWRLFMLVTNDHQGGVVGPSGECRVLFSNVVHLKDGCYGGMVS